MTCAARGVKRAAGNAATARVCRRAIGRVAEAGGEIRLTSARSVITILLDLSR
jgi:hypothetical protein